MRKVSISISQALFTLVFLIFFFTLLNGYLQNIVADYRANTWLVLAGVVIELAITLWFARRRVVVARDALELAGWLVVVVGTWLYFVAPSLPTLLPATTSSDAVRVYQQVLFSYPEGKLVSWYPAAGAFLVAMFSHWLAWAPLRVLNFTAAAFIALAAGAVYGMTCARLPRKRISKIAALAAPALLFVPWSYFAGIINGEQFFFAQALAQLCVLAALWYTMSYADQPALIFAALIGAALLATVAAYPIFAALPLALFALVVFARVLASLWARSRGQMAAGADSTPPVEARGEQSALAALGSYIALLIVAAIVLQSAGILELVTAKISATSDVGAGGVTNPSLENLGGPIFLLLALIGIPLAWRANAAGKVLIGFLIAWLAQFGALLVVQPFLQISGYRVDKTFYILIFPLAILAALPLARAAERVTRRAHISGRVAAAGFIGIVLLIGVSVAALRPPQFDAPFTEAELQTAFWAKENLDTNQISFIDASTIRAYWLAFGLWRETLPNEWFQWIPAGTKMGPPTFDEWLRDPAWPRWIFLSDATAPPMAPAQVIYRNGVSAIAQKDAPTLAAPAPARRAVWYFGSAIKLLGYDLPRVNFSPGETVTLTTYIESIYPPPVTAGWRMEVLDHTGAVAAQVAGDPFANKYPLQRWPPGRYARDEWSLPLDPHLSPGVYTLQLGLYGRMDGKEFPARLADPASGVLIPHKPPLDAAPLTTIKIPVAPPRAKELDAATPLQARVGENFMLARYALQFDAAPRVVHLALYWQDLSKTENDYTVFVHVLDANGKIVAQKDAPPLDGAYPTSIWDAQEIVKDSYELAIPADARAPFSIEIGMYSPTTLKRLPVGNDDHILLPNVIQ